MASSQIEISKIEIDPNRLPEFTKLPLPDFAIKALVKNEYTYKPKCDLLGGHVGDGHDKKPGKLADHIRFVQSHIDSDGPRVWGSISTRLVSNEHSAQPDK
jgi:hypothetical protein